MPLDTIIGNETVVSQLRHSLHSGHIGHAYILEGASGTGRMTTATAFAAALLETDDPHTHPDFTIVTNLLYDTGKRETPVLVDTIRTMKRDIYIRPYRAPHKVYILPYADTMQAAAQNSLLKVFEEPPDYCVILLLAENANAFLPTIRSRSPILRLHPLSAAQVQDYLIRQRQAAPEAAQQCAILSGGSIGRALALFEDDSALTMRKESIRLIAALSGGTYRDMYDWVRFLKKNRADVSFILGVVLSFFRDAMLYKLNPQHTGIVNTDQTAALTDFCARLRTRSALRLCEITLDYQKMIEQNANYSAAVLCMAVEYWEEIHGRNSRS